MDWTNLDSNIDKLVCATKCVLWIVFTINLSACLAQERPYIKVFFDVGKYGTSYFESETSYSGSSWIENIQSKIPVSNEIYFTPKNALKLRYKSAKDGDWTATIKYADVRGMDFFEPADHLSFWIYSSTLDLNSIPKITLVHSSNTQNETINLSSYITNTTNQWQHVLVPLSEFSNDLDINKIVGIQFMQSNASNEPNEIFIDQIELITKNNTPIVTQVPELISVKGYERHFDLAWKPVTDTAVRYVQIQRKSNSMANFKVVAIQSPWISGFSDFVENHESREYEYRISFLNSEYKESSSSNSIKSSTKEMADEEFLNMIQLSNFRYYWEGCEPNSGLALENIPGRS